MWARQTWLIFVLLAAGWSTLADEPPTSDRQPRRIDGQQLLTMIERGQLRPAERILRQQLHRQAGGQVSYLLGVVLERQFQLGEAAEHLRRAVTAQPAKVRWRHALARVLLGLGRCDSAITELDQCLETVSTPEAQAVFHYDKAMCALNLGDLDTAEHSLRAALVGAQPPAHTQAKLGRLLLDRGNADAALPMLEEAVRVDPSDLEARFALGLALRRAERWTEAIATLREVTDAVPSHAGALYGLGQALARVGQAVEGRAVLERFKRLSVVEDQIDNHRQFLQTAPTDLDARRSLARLLLQVGRIDEAAETLRETVAAGHRDAETLSLLATILDHQGRPAAAARARAAAKAIVAAASPQ